MDKQIKLLHVLEISTCGAHIKPSNTIKYTAILNDGTTESISFEMFESLKSKYKVFRGYLQKGGGKHNFYGYDINEVIKLVY